MDSAGEEPVKNAETLGVAGGKLADLWERLKWLEASMEPRPWVVYLGSSRRPMEGRSKHGLVFACFGRDEQETLRTYEFVTVVRNVLPDAMAALDRVVVAAEAVLAGVDAVAGDAELLALREAVTAWRVAAVPEYDVPTRALVPNPPYWTWGSAVVPEIPDRFRTGGRKEGGA